MRYLDELKKLNLPQNSFAIFGSGPMAIRNMREITDLDLIVKPDLWQRLKEKYSKHLVPRKNTGELRIGHISIFQNWLPWFDDVNALIDKADLIDGIRYVKLENVISWKKQMARKKDLQDIKTIQKKSAMKINPSIFREYDIRGKYPQEIDLKTAYALGRAFALSLKAKKIAVACDRRLESALIKPAFLLGVKETGCQIFDLGIDSTPAMFFAVYDKKLDGGVSLTASHNPLGYVGLKLCDKKGSLLGLNTGVAKIKQLAEKVVLSKSDVFKTAKTVKIDIAEHYYKLAEKITDFKKIRGFKIVLDASSGSGAKLADYFFVRLNSKIIKMNFKAGDKFTDHGPNPILPQNQKPAILTVKKNKADMGVIFDGDGDRCIFIDERGEFVHPYYMNCLLSELILKKYKKTAIAMDARLRIGLSETIKKAQGQPVVCRSGYANLVKLMQEQKILFGCENSGHYFFNFKIIDKKSNYIFGDALMPILLVLGHLKENNIHLSEATAKFKKQYFISGEINYKGVSFSSLEKKLARKYSSYKSDDLDGLSIYSPDWFLNIRPSKTEPLIRLNMEAKNKSALSQIKKEVTSLLK